MITPVYPTLFYSDLFSAIPRIGKIEPLHSFLQLKSHYPNSDLFFVSSGQAALFLIFKTISKKWKKNEVILPANICPTVAYAVVRAGCKVVPCDIESDSPFLDLSKLENLINDQTACVVAAHLFGITEKIEPIKKICQGKSIPFIEDGAQAFNLETPLGKAGAGGDFGVLSFGKAKNITAMEGGILIINQGPFSSVLGEMKEELASWEIQNSASMFISALAYKILMQPLIFSLGSNLLPDLDVKSYSTEFSLGLGTKVQKAFLKGQIKRADEMSEMRKKSAEEYHSAVTPIEQIRLFQFDTKGVYLFFPLILPNKGKREKAFKMLKSSGIYPGRGYQCPINKIKGLNQGQDLKCPQAEAYSNQLLCLPTGPHITGPILEKIVHVFYSVL